MPTLLFTHPDCLLHQNGPVHPEDPSRLRAVLAELEKPNYKALVRREAPKASKEEIARVHDGDYVDQIQARVPKEGYVALDDDTSLSPGSGEAALRAAGSVVAAVDAVMATEGSNAFCAVRPPGHHAEHATPMGFCLYNNIAVGAAHALAKYGLTRVAIIDFDVHHGNGTQDWAAKEPKILFLSSHQFPLWPGTGAANDQGPHGNILNLTLTSESGSASFRKAVEATLLPAIDRFKPELIMISAGFDAHRDDPLAGLNLEAEDYGWVTRKLLALAQKYSKGRVVSVLEGGYDLKALAASAGAHVSALLAAHTGGAE